METKDYDEYVANPTERAGQIGSWGEYKLTQIAKREVPANVIPMRDPLVLVHFADDDRLTHPGVSAWIRKSKAKYGVF